MENIDLDLVKRFTCNTQEIARGKRQPTYKNEIIDNLNGYYTEGKKSPVVAHIIFRDEFKKGNKKFGFFNGKSRAIDIINYLDRTKAISKAYKNFVNCWKTMYHMNGDKKLFLAENDYVVIGKVKKTSWYKKIKYALFLKTLK